MPAGEAPDVDLVDDRLVPGGSQAAVVLPHEPGVDDHRLGHVAAAVRGVLDQVVVPQLVGEDRLFPVDVPGDGLGVRIQDQLGGVGAHAQGRLVGTVDPVAVELAGPDVGQVAVPAEGRLLGQIEPRLLATAVEEAELHPLRHLGEEGEVGPGSIKAGPERVRLPRPYLHGCLTYQLMQPDTGLASAWGVAHGYHDISGRWVEPDAESVSRVLATLGAGDPEPPPSPVRFVEQGTTPELEEPHEVVTEDGATLTVGDRLPADLPPGYHRLHRLRDGAGWRLVVTPRRCYFPDELRTWGWAVQLYALRSRSSWGHGDLADLRELARWSAGLGARILLLNPLHAALPTPPQEPSPYYPSSRRFRNPLYIRVEEVPGAERMGERLAGLAEAGHRLNSNRGRDRDRVLELKTAALEELFSSFAGSDEFDRYREREGQGL